MLRRPDAALIPIIAMTANAFTEDVKEALDAVFGDKEIGIVLLTEKFGREFPDLIDEAKLNRRLPLLIEIPDRHGTGRKDNFITEYVSEAIGLHL